MGFGKGFGKTILFGDHFVVYGLLGIPCALSCVTTAKVERSKNSGFELVDNRPATPDYKLAKKGEYDSLISRVIEFMGVKEGLKITLGGDLFAASGVGASAACAAAIARAINEEFKMGWNDEKINEAAFEGETAGSGTPSGIDNTAAVFGGLLLFRKNTAGGKNFIEVMRIKAPVEIVLGNTGKTSLTKEVVGDVKKLKDSSPEKINSLFDEYAKLVEEARIALQNYDLKKVGSLMTKNHSLLQKLTVSCNELDELVEASLKAGAFGAKLTGTGRGGLMIALTPGKELQQKVFDAIKAKGFEATKAMIG